MSDAIRTQQTIIRAELRAVFGDRPRLIKAFENLLFDVSVTIPDALTGNASDADDATATAQFLAQRASSIAQQALDLAAAVGDGPPQVVLPSPSDSFDDWLSVVMQLAARVARLEADLANLKDGPTP